MEKLTKRINEENRVVYAKTVDEVDGTITTTRKKQKIAYEVLCRLAELEDKIECEQLVELPCKVGDTVYCVIKVDDDEFNPYYIRESKCRLLNYNQNGFVIVPDIDEIWLDLKGVFATREQAEAHIRELEGGTK